MKLTKKKAKKICLEVWEYLRDHPEISSKVGLPIKLYDKIKNMFIRCPLCKCLDGCGSDDDRCPISPCCNNGKGIYDKWCESKQKRTRKKYASIIVEKVKAWKV